jgi:hypothetical protein
VLRLDVVVDGDLEPELVVVRRDNETGETRAFVDRDRRLGMMAEQVVSRGPPHRVGGARIGGATDLGVQRGDAPAPVE